MDPAHRRASGTLRGLGLHYSLIGPVAVGGALDWCGGALGAAGWGGGFVLIELLAPLPREPYGWRRNKGRVQLACKTLGSGRALDD